MVNSITRLETVLQVKLELLNNCICDNCECVPSALTFDIVGGGIIKDGKEPNTYIFTGNKEENIITFVTNPNVVIKAHKFGKKVDSTAGRIKNETELGFSS